MTSELVLEMLNNNKIEELKERLKDEIFSKSLKSNSGSNDRYKAMKRYIKHTYSTDERFIKPCKVNNQYCFIDGYTVIMTNELIGEIEEYDNSENNYFKLDQMFKIDGNPEEIDLNKVLAEAKSQGYKLNKKEVAEGQDFKYLLKYKDAYYKIGLIDKAYNIINEGKKMDATYVNNKAPLLIENNLGKSIILPIYLRDGITTGKIIIEYN